MQINQQKLLIASNLGLHILNLSQTQGRDLKVSDIKQTSLPQISVNRLCKRDETIWIGTDNGLYKTYLESDNLHILDIYKHDPANLRSISGHIINDFLVNDKQQLWIGSYYGGLSLYDEDSNDFINYTYNPEIKGGISSSIVNCLFVDDFDIM